MVQTVFSLQIPANVRVDDDDVGGPVDLLRKMIVRFCDIHPSFVGEDGLGGERTRAHRMLLSLDGRRRRRRRPLSLEFVVLDEEGHQIGPIPGRLVDRPNYASWPNHYWVLWEYSYLGERS
ncbi:hypothetical protein BHM03_00039267 [Ensete ventricosum]|nr:hypothetical protein BHM03_00039267 [Ensete ventricosum]